MNDYYLQQINDKLELIKSNTDQITTYLPNMSTELYYIEQNTQELISGDKIILKQIQATQSSVIMVAMILLIILLFNFIVRSLK